MDKSTGFNYTYSAAVNKEVQQIRNKYMPRKESKFEELRHLDRRVQSAGMIQGLTVGIIGFLLFGLGVCMGAEIIGESMLLGILLGLAGAVAMLFAYPIYRRSSAKAKEKFVPRILELSSELLGRA